MNTLINTIVSPEERDILINFLDQLEQNLHKQNVDLNNFINIHCPFDMCEKMTAYFVNELDSQNEEGLRIKILDLRHSLKMLPILELKIAFVPDDAFRISLGIKTQIILNKKYLLDLKVDPTIIGGAVVSMDGRISKYTVKEYFMNKGRSINGL